MSNHQCICGNILMSNEVCGCPQSQAISTDLLKTLEPQFGPGTHQEIESLSEQVDILIAQSADRHQRLIDLQRLVEASRDGFLNGEPYILTYTDIIEKLKEIDQP